MATSQRFGEWAYLVECGLCDGDGCDACKGTGQIEVEPDKDDHDRACDAAREGDL